jgi:hypothetical protein
MAADLRELGTEDEESRIVLQGVDGIQGVRDFAGLSVPLARQYTLAHAVD